MALTPDQINSFTTRAKQAGYSDGEIQQEIARKSAEVQTPQTPVVPQVPIQQTSQSQQPTSIAGTVGSGAISGAKSAASVIGSIAMGAPKFALNLAKEFVKPAVKGAKTVASAGEEAIQTGQYLAGNKNAFNSPILPDAVKLSQNEKDQIRSKPLDEAIKQTAGIGSYAIPFGKAGFIGSKAILPGAAVAASRSISEGDTPEEVLGNAIIGGATAGTLQLGGKILSGLKGNAGKVASAAESGANSIEQGTRQIKLKPSIYGASQEQAVNNTLDRLGFKGSPQNQYENLQPAMNKLEGQVQDFIAQNPDISVPKESIKQSFLTSLKSSLRSGEITEKQATAETNKYLNDLVKASGGTGKFTDIPLNQLRDLKKLVNEDYGPVKKLLDTGGNLTPKQRVIAVAWDSLDNAVKKSAPEVKSLLTDESNLYRAAPSLSGARFNPPVLRAMGTSVPQPVTQLVRDAAKQGLRGTADVASKMSETIPNLNMGANTTTVAGQMSAILPSLGHAPPALNEVPNEGQNPISTNQGQIQANNNQDHTQSIAQGLGEKPPTYINMWGASPKELYREYQNAYQHGDVKTAAYLFKVYQDEIKNLKDNGGGGKPLTGPQQILMTNADSADRSINKVEELLSKDPSLLIKSEIPGIGGRLAGASTYNTARKEIADVIGRMRTGAVINPEEMATYLSKLPQAGDRPEDIAYKISEMRKIFGELKDRIKNQSIGAPTQDGLGASPPVLDNTNL